MTRPGLRRPAGTDQRVTPLELFYDLVFVFAITQVSHHLLDDLTWRGAGQSAFLLLVVWWSWNYTTWVTNELDPESPVVRLLMIALMLASLLMSAAMPDAFGTEAGLFIGSYLAIQVGRHVFLTFIAAGPRTLERERAGRILVWFVAAGVFWVAGAIADGEARTALWLIALAIDYGAPLALFRIPGRPFAAGESAWQVSTAPLRRAVRAVHHHRPRRVDRDHRRDGQRRRARRPDPRRVRDRVPDDGGDVVAVLHVRRADRRAPARARAEPHTHGARRLHLPSRRARGGDHRVGRRRRDRHRPPDGTAHGRRGRGGRPRPGDLPARAHAVPPAPHRDGGLAPPRRGRRPASSLASWPATPTRSSSRSSCSACSSPSSPPSGSRPRDARGAASPRRSSGSRRRPAKPRSAGPTAARRRPTRP